MSENNWGSDKDYLYKELKEICKENWIKLTLSTGFRSDGEAESCLIFNWNSMWDFYS